MKRSDALAGLSRDHHQALAAALRLRRADPATLDAALAGFAAFYDRLGARHFDQEERVLPGALPADSPGWAAACERMCAEHADLRTRGAAVGEIADDDARLAAARELGERLDAHVRFEERELFVMLEERLDPAALAALGAALDH